MSREEEKFQELRRKAEELIEHSTKPTEAQNRNFMELLHELRIHQKELELQNEELRDAQEELSSLYSEYADLYEFAPVAFITLSAKGFIRRINLNGVKLLGKERRLLTKAGLITFVADESKQGYYRSLKQADETGVPQRSEIALRPAGAQKSGSAPVWVQMDVQADHDAAGELLQWRLALSDITARVEAEDEVRNLLEEKQQLLQEVHHRIKNQMHSIVSIISYQMYDYDDTQTCQALEGLKERIYVMQSLYDLLFTETPRTSLHLPSFLQKILGYLRDAYLRNAAVQIHSDIEEIEVSAKQSFPLGIIINEAVVNALKYAFSGRESGNLWITARREDGQHVSIIVADDGVGIPEEKLPEEQHGFGLTLIRGYARQLDGEMEFRRRDGGGTELSVTLMLRD
jgi:PAS domain S-box-containing protein